MLGYHNPAEELFGDCMVHAICCEDVKQWLCFLSLAGW
jgi:hypothetical protein